jgi:hypothetical protein
MGTREAGAKGGHARAAKMTAKERSEAAKKAAREMGEGQKAQAEVSGQPYSKRSPSPVKEANA